MLQLEEKMLKSMLTQLLKGIVIFFAGMSFISFAVAQEQTQTQTVIAQGIGSDIEGAAKNAAENALTQVVGTFIRQDKLLEKHTAIVDGIRQQSSRIDTKTLEYSQGSIAEFEVNSSRSEGGIFYLEAKVTVRMDNFKAFAEKLAEGSTEIDVGLYAQAANNLENKGNSSSLVIQQVLRPIFKGMASEFTVGKAVLFKSFISTYPIPDDGDLTFRALCQSETALAIPVSIHLKSDFLANTLQVLKNISSDHKLISLGDLNQSMLYAPRYSTDAIDIIGVSTGKSVVDLFEMKKIFTPEVGSDAEEICSQLNRFGNVNLSRGCRFDGIFPRLKLRIDLIGDGGEIIDTQLISQTALLYKLKGIPPYSNNQQTIDYYIRRYEGSVDQPNMINLVNMRSRVFSPLLLSAQDVIVVLDLPVEILKKTKKVEIKFVES